MLMKVSHCSLVRWLFVSIVVYLWGNSHAPSGALTPLGVTDVGNGFLFPGPTIPRFRSSP
jgi:hypothetical protein